MNAAMANGERMRAVRLVARSWEKAGWIDATHKAGIDRLFADDRVRLGTALRALVCFFTWFAVGSGFGFVMAFVAQAAFRGNDFGVPLIVVGVLCLIGAEVAHHGMRTSGIGADDGLELSALAFLLAGVFVLFELDHASTLGAFFLIGATLLGIAAWRWGGWLYGALTSVGLFAALSRLPSPRVAWILGAAVVAWPLLRVGDATRLVPSQRAALRSAFVVALFALYGAVNYASVDRHLIEGNWLRTGESTPPAVLLPIGLAATALLPMAVLWLGIRRRDQSVIACGLLFSALSIGTLRWYVHWMPLWAVLLLAGVVLGGAALVIRRWLDAGPGRERSGFTAEPLLEGGRRQWLEAAAAVAVFSPAAQPQGAGETGFGGAGGQSGGGGATTSF
ncbi:MAG: hypothetical protein ABI609_16880 [Acidobacteriota bacterium]